MFCISLYDVNTLQSQGIVSTLILPKGVSATSSWTAKRSKTLCGTTNVWGEATDAGGKQRPGSALVLLSGHSTVSNTLPQTNFM